MNPAIEFVSTQRSGQVQHVAQRLPGSHPATVYAGYRRHTEFDAGDHAGQDWCGLRAFGTTCVAVVADGVSQSFMGDIAARVVGRGLLDALSLEGEAALQEPRCHALLEQLRAAAQQEVDAFALSAAVPDFLRAALEAKRTSSGTQTVVAASIVDLFTGRGRLLLVGDIAVTVHRRIGPPAVIAGDRRARWSNLHGLRGAAVNEQLEDVTGVVLASDGMPAPLGIDRVAFDDGARVAQAISAGAERDDASFVAMFAGALAHSPHAGLPATAPVPATVLGDAPQAPYFAPPAAASSPAGSTSPLPRSPYAPQAPPQPTQPPAPPRAPRRWRTILGLVLVATGLAAAADRILDTIANDPMPKQARSALAADARPARSSHTPPHALRPTALGKRQVQSPPRVSPQVHPDAPAPCDAALDAPRDVPPDESAVPQLAPDHGQATRHRGRVNRPKQPSPSTR